MCAPSSEMATAMTRPPSSTRRDSFIVFASHTITRPSASPVTAVLPSFAHAAETTVALWPTMTRLPGLPFA